MNLMFSARSEWGTRKVYVQSECSLTAKQNESLSNIKPDTTGIICVELYPDGNFVDRAGVYLIQPICIQSMQLKYVSLTVSTPPSILRYCNHL